MAILRLFFIFFVFMLMQDFAYATAITTNQTSSSTYFLTLSDIHFDPFINCDKKKPCPLIDELQKAPITQWESILSASDPDITLYGHDTNYHLFKSALLAAKQVAVAKQVRFVIILGDFLSHNFKHNYKIFSKDTTSMSYRIFVNKVLMFLSDEIAKAFPLTDVYTVVGNNDTYQSDYHLTPQGPFFKDTVRLWALLIKTNANRMAMGNLFPYAGYYAVTIPNQANLRLIVLNTNLFSYKAKGSDIKQAAMKQLVWLQKELFIARANKQKVFIAMHIPQGIDVYLTKRVRLFRILALWKSDYIERFQQLLKVFSPEINAIFAGHLHLEWLQVITFEDNQNEIVEAGTQSISPIFGNNPGFKVYQYSPQTLQIAGCTTYDYPLNKPFQNKKWQERNDMIESNIF